MYSPTNNKLTLILIKEVDLPCMYDEPGFLKITPSPSSSSTFCNKFFRTRWLVHKARAATIYVHSILPDLTITTSQFKIQKMGGHLRVLQECCGIVFRKPNVVIWVQGRQIRWFCVKIKKLQLLISLSFLHLVKAHSLCIGLNILCESTKLPLPCL
jgi:hypothetical protein